MNSWEKRGRIMENSEQRVMERARATGATVITPHTRGLESEKERKREGSRRAT
jgi:hypothetical protein